MEGRWFCIDSAHGFPFRPAVTMLAMRDTYGLAASGTRLGCGRLSGVVTRGAAGWWLRSHPLNLIQFVLAKGMSVMTYALRSLGGFRCRDVVCWYASGCALAISREARR